MRVTCGKVSTYSALSLFFDIPWCSDIGDELAEGKYMRMLQRTRQSQEIGR